MTFIKIFSVHFLTFLRALNSKEFEYCQIEMESVYAFISLLISLLICEEIISIINPFKENGPITKHY